MRINAKNVGGLRINGKVVGGMRIGGKVVALGGTPAPAGTVVRVTLGIWPGTGIVGFAKSPIPQTFGALAPNPAGGLDWNAIVWGNLGITNSGRIIRLSAPPGTTLAALPTSVSLVSDGTTYTGARQDGTLATRAGGSRQIDYLFPSNLLTLRGQDRTSVLIAVAVGDTQDLTLNF